jgi:hypothetical protein
MPPAKFMSWASRTIQYMHFTPSRWPFRQGPFTFPESQPQFSRCWKSLSTCSEDSGSQGMSCTLVGAMVCLWSILVQDQLRSRGESTSIPHMRLRRTLHELHGQARRPTFPHLAFSCISPTAPNSIAGNKMQYCCKGCCWLSSGIRA